MEYSEGECPSNQLAGSAAEWLRHNVHAKATAGYSRLQQATAAGTPVLSETQCATLKGGEGTFTSCVGLQGALCRLGESHAHPKSS